MAPFDRLHTSSYLSSIVIMAISFTVFEIKRDIGYWSKNAIFSYALPFNFYQNLELPRFFPKF